MAEIDINGILFNGPNNNGTAEHTNENGYQIGSLIYADNMNDDMRAIQTDLSKIYGMLLGKQVINYNLYDQSTTFKSTKIDWNRINTNINKIKTADITNSAITADKIASNAVTTVKINNGAVTTDKLADNAVTSAKIADNTIVNADINSSAAIAYSKLSLNNSIQETDIVNGAVTSAKIADGTIVNADINANAAIAKSKLALTGTITNDDINADAEIAKSKLALAGTLTKTDFYGTSFTGDGRIPSTWVDLSNVSVLDTSLGILNGTQSNGTARSYYVNNAVSTDYNKLLGTNASGAMTVVNVPVSKITNAVTSMNTTANAATFKFPTWNAYGIITGTVANGTAYKKQVTINGVNTSVFSGDNNFPETLVCPTTYGAENTKQFLCCENNSLNWETLKTGTTTLKVNNTAYDVTGNGGNINIYAPTTSGTRGQYLKSNGSGQPPTWTDSIGDGLSNVTLGIHGLAGSGETAPTITFRGAKPSNFVSAFFPCAPASHNGDVAIYESNSCRFARLYCTTGISATTSQTVSITLNAQGNGITKINSISMQGTGAQFIKDVNVSGANNKAGFIPVSIDGNGYVIVIGDTAHANTSVSVTVSISYCNLHTGYYA